jgi:very-short-patch-repair endonuclease
MSIPKNDDLLGNARKLRRNMTPQERKLWYLFLKDYPVKIYKQRIIGPYIVDFYCSGAKLVIEIDGSQHYEDTGKGRDTERDRYLTGLGLEVVRYSNADINARFKNVCLDIHQHIRKNG